MALIFWRYGYDDNVKMADILAKEEVGLVSASPHKEVRRGVWVWQSDEPIVQLEQLARLTDAEKAQYDRISSPSRRREYLTVRASVSAILGKRISYRPSKAPFIADDDRFISISHTGNWVVVAVDTKPTGVDTEYMTRDISRVSSRIFSSHEMSLTDNPAVLWCAKEAAYKAYGREGIDLYSDITVTDITGNRIFVNILSRHITLLFLTIDKHIIVVCE